VVYVAEVLVLGSNSVQCTRDGDSCQRLELESRLESLFLGLETCLRLACNDLRLDLKDLRLDLGLEAW